MSIKSEIIDDTDFKERLKAFSSSVFVILNWFRIYGYKGLEMLKKFSMTVVFLSYST